MKQIQMCKRLVVDNENGPTYLLGIIEKKEGQLLYFRTAKKLHIVNEKLILRLEDTKIFFKEEGLLNDL